MPTAPDRFRSGRPLRAAGVLAVLGMLVVTGCGRVGPPMMPASSTESATAAASPSDDESASSDPTATSSGTGSPTSPTSPGGTASPGDTASPGGTANPSGSVTPCTSVTPIRIERSTVEPRRTTDIVTVVSDGRNLTSGTREQTDFVTPSLLGPDNTTTITESATLATIADLVEKSSKNTVLLTRPEAPDTGIDANKRPFNASGTYVLYNSSGLLSADVVVRCAVDATAGGQEQRWRFTAEADNTVGTINCAVEPPKGNAVARQVYGTFC